MRRQLEIADDFRTQHAGDVRSGGSAAARRDLLSNATAADDISTLQHQRGQPRAAEIRSSGQTVMSAPNDNGIVFWCRSHVGNWLPVATNGSSKTAIVLLPLVYV